MTLLAKLFASLAPLWTELLLFLPVSLLFFCVYLSLPPLLVLSLTPFLFVLSTAAGCAGLAIGSLSSQPAQAIRNARIFTFFLLFLIPLLKEMSASWFLPLVGMTLWLLIYSRRAPNRAVFLFTSGIVATALAVMNIQRPFGLSLSFIHPTNFVTMYFGNTHALPNGIVNWEMPSATVTDLFAYPISVSGVYCALALVFFMLARARFQYAE